MGDLYVDIGEQEDRPHSGILSKPAPLDAYEKKPNSPENANQLWSLERGPPTYPDSCFIQSVLGNGKEIYVIDMKRGESKAPTRLDAYRRKLLAPYPKTITEKGYENQLWTLKRSS